eukprot:SAG11_NODE_16400_length_548_cov_1.033408_1_plen_54_part_10
MVHIYGAIGPAVPSTRAGRLVLSARDRRFILIVVAAMGVCVVVGHGLVRSGLHS